MDITNFINFSILFTGIYNIILSLTLYTKNFKSAFIFKVIPFFTGLFCVLSALHLMNII